jgi:hypothetical protein
MRFAVIVEKAKNNYSAYAPDLPGCVTTGPTVDETLTNMRNRVSSGWDARRWRTYPGTNIYRGYRYGRGLSTWSTD